MIMKAISIKPVKTMLDTLDMDESSKELILNNLSLYNSLVKDWQTGERHNAYLLFQIQSATVKQINEVKKKYALKVDKDEENFKEFKNKFKKVN
jgi:hypothetical protein